jgi:hypothetical protein
MASFTEAEINAKVLADYRELAGKVVLVSEVECYDERSASVTAVCDPPVVARIRPYSGDAKVREEVTRWTDARHCDPMYDLEILEPHPALARLRPSWVYGTCRSVDGDVEPTSIVLADDAMQEAYTQAKGLPDDAVAGPPTTMTP